MSKDNTILLLGGAAAFYFLFLKPGGNSPGSIANNAILPANGAAAYVPPGNDQSAATAPPANVTVTQPGNVGNATLYPYLIAGAPLPLPNGYNGSYYEQFVYPAMLAADGNVGSHDYVFTQDEANQYLANYVDIQQWIKSLGGNKTPYQHLVYHWQTYAVPEKRTFLPLWSVNPSQWVPPPPNPKGSGSFWGTLLKVATVVGGGALEVASAGTLTPIVAPATASALAIENAAVHGVNDLSDPELEILFTGAAVLYNILPFYLQSNRKEVKAIYGRLDQLLKQYS